MINDKRLLEYYYAEGNVGLNCLIEHFKDRKNTPRDKPMKVRVALNHARSMGSNVSVSDIVRGFQQLEECGCGKYIRGRKTKYQTFEKRFEFTSSCFDILKVLHKDGGDMLLPDDEDDELVDGGKSLDSDDSDDNDEGFFTHVFQLRADLSVNLRLPDDLTASEADRLSSLMKIIVVV